MELEQGRLHVHLLLVKQRELLLAGARLLGEGNDIPGVLLWASDGDAGQALPTK